MEGKRGHGASEAIWLLLSKSPSPCPPLPGAPGWFSHSKCQIKSPPGVRKLQNNEGGVWPSGGRHQIPAISSRGHRDYVITHNLDLHREMESSYYSFPCRESRYLEIGTLVPNLSLNPFRPAEVDLYIMFVWLRFCNIFLLLVGTTCLGAKILSEKRMWQFSLSVIT